jgi:hypothetical protein
MKGIRRWPVIEEFRFVDMVFVFCEHDVVSRISQTDPFTYYQFLISQFYAPCTRTGASGAVL